MNIKNRVRVLIGLALAISVAMPIALYTMKRPNPEKIQETLLPKEALQYSDIQWVISQKFQQFPEIKNAINFLAEAPIELQGDYEDENHIYVATNGKVVATASEVDDSVKLWDVVTGKQLIPIITHPADISALAMDGDIIISGSKDGTIQISKTDGELLHTHKYPHTIEAMAMDNNLIAVASDHTVHILSIDNCNLNVLRPIKYNNFVNSVVIRGNIVAFSISNHNLKIWDINRHTLLHTIEDISEFNSVATNGKLVAAKRSDGVTDTIDIYDISTGKLAYPSIHSSFSQDEFNQIAIDNDNLVVGSESDTTIWNLNTGNLLKTINVPGTTVAIKGGILVMARYGENPKILDLNPFKGTPETNPILWIINYATVPQLDFIKRSYEAVQADEEFIIDFPSEDAKVFLSFPMFVRQYLLERSNIRRPSSAKPEQFGPIQ